MTGPAEQFKAKAEEVVKAFKAELSQVRTNRPSASLVEDLRVDYYGEHLPIKQVGSITLEPPRSIIIQVWDKEAIPNVVKAIEALTLGLSTSVEGNLIRVHLPELSEERRMEVIKHVKKITENYRIQVRHLRDEMNKVVQKLSDEGALDEDAKFRIKEKIQEETEAANSEIEDLLESKIKEVKS